ncbi:UPF0187-domain-containing protein [Lentinus tigrinus ALCF2SS1-6]|uniref:UPF0187-domain-containing protein n=1 Tax=Lentinus tigrinus ALCF2SS1-6 TaxID=1328759 RepID=A0A5C2S3G2_9APHY|nr:UPF0187-domain-containing protein [Lentinus tigrinus ALCF2SS1-6]
MTDFARVRSSTGHVLLPAFDAHQERVLLPVASKENLVSWTFGRGTVIWRIWPAVLLHTVFAAAVVSISLCTSIHLGIPNVMLTLLGVVIGFVISYRASSGYDRYWQGRSAWSDLARSARTFTRLAWIHVPLKMSPTQLNADGTSPNVDVHVARRIMAEKRIALDLVEGFIVAIKHHLRGEMGIYYEDLYPLVKPLHEHVHHRRNSKKQPTVEVSEVTSPRDLHPEVPPFARPGPSASSPSPSRQDTLRDPVIPPINTYGTFMTPPLHHMHSSSSLSSVSSDPGERERHPLLPGAVPGRAANKGIFGDVRSDLIPFANVMQGVARMLGFRKRATERNVSGEEVDVEAGESSDDDAGGIQRRWADDDVNGNPQGENGHRHRERMRARLWDTGERLGITHSKHRPRIAGGGENLPLEILRSLSIWLSVLDERGVVPGGALGGMLGCLQAFEDSLSTLERILTTPLPFVYSVHIRTVWIYLFFLPFQLIDLFGWYAIPGVGIAAFIYLGLIAAGEEIEQPFGYDENDLDLDFFCRAIIHADIERIKRTSCPNVYLGAQHLRAAHDQAVDTQTRVDAVFGGGNHL